MHLVSFLASKSLPKELHFFSFFLFYTHCINTVLALNCMPIKWAHCCDETEVKATWEKRIARDKMNARECWQCLWKEHSRYEHNYLESLWSNDSITGIMPFHHTHTALLGTKQCTKKFSNCSCWFVKTKPTLRTQHAAQEEKQPRLLYTGKYGS